MYLTTVLPILCLTSSITCLRIPTNNHHDDRNKPQDEVKTGRWPVIAGPGPVLIDPGQFPPLEPVRKFRKNRRSLEPKREPLPDMISVHPEQVTLWMKELDEILSRGSSPSEKLKKRYEGEEEKYSVWFNIGGGSHNDFRLIFVPSHSGFTDDWGSDYSHDPPANQKRDGTDLVPKVSRSPVVDKRAQALAEILAALYDQKDPNKTGAGDHKTLDRRAPINAIPVPVDAKPVQDEVIHRIFKLYGNKKNKRGLSSRQSPQDVSQQILQTLFRFEDDEEWKWNAPTASARKRWSEFPEIEEISETLPEKRNHKNGGGISTDEVDDLLKTDAQDPNSYAWPDISLKVREALPKEADEVSQRIIVTIFRMQENFRHKRSIDIIEIDQQVKEDTVEPRGYSMFPGWLTPFFERTRNVRLRWQWIRDHARHNRRRDNKIPEAKLQRRTRYSTPPKVLPRPTVGPYDNKKWKQWCQHQRACVLPWNIRRLQSSREIVQRIIDSIDRHSQQESQIIKRDVAGDILAWLESINRYFEVTRNGIPSSDGRPTVSYISAGPEDKKADGYKSTGSVVRRLASRDLAVSLPELGSDFMALIDKLRKEKYGEDDPGPVVYKAAWDIINGAISTFTPLKKRDTPSTGISGILDSIKLALRCKAPIQTPPTAVLEKRKPQPQDDSTHKLNKRYDPETYPWWSGSSENDGEDNTSTNPWAKGNPCARLRFSAGCGGGYKRSTRNARSRLDNVRKRISEDDVKNVSKQQTINDEELAKRIKVNKRKKVNQALTKASANWKDPGFIRLDPFRDWKFWGTRN
ncbi:hypothetical protein TWF506_009668 [Arthrobotrys conoides]|uniref:Uncharacterized protein n=1 Tax=Arthrobotrys conoides TaxID=74498 RepID=A0AAN8PCS5_9PEZI